MNPFEGRLGVGAMRRPAAPESCSLCPPPPGARCGTGLRPRAAVWRNAAAPRGVAQL